MVHPILYLLRLSRLGRPVVRCLAKILALLGDSDPSDGARGCSMVYLGGTEEEKDARSCGSFEATGRKRRPNGSGAIDGDKSGMFTTRADVSVHIPVASNAGLKR